MQMNVEMRLYDYEMFRFVNFSHCYESGQALAGLLMGRLMIGGNVTVFPAGREPYPRRLA